MTAFIDQYRSAYGVEPICKQLPIAPSTYYEHVRRRERPEAAPPRVKRDAELSREIRRVFNENFAVYGVRKIWRQMQREGFAVARCTVARLMQKMGLQGVIRGKRVRTTIADKTAICPLDRVNRQFRAPRPNMLWVSDFTYVATWSGFVYVAFVVDAYARRIVGCASAGRRTRASCSTHWSRPCTIAGPSAIGVSQASVAVIACGAARRAIANGTGTCTVAVFFRPRVPVAQKVARSAAHAGLLPSNALESG
jgi:hypothetical protein